MKPQFNLEQFKAFLRFTFQRNSMNLNVCLRGKMFIHKNGEGFFKEYNM